MGDKDPQHGSKNKRMKCMENTLVLPVRLRKISTHCMHACTLDSEHKPQTSLSPSFVLSCSKVCPTPLSFKHTALFLYAPLFLCNLSSQGIIEAGKKKEMKEWDRWINWPTSICLFRHVNKYKPSSPHFFRRYTVQWQWNWREANRGERTRKKECVCMCVYEREVGEQGRLHEYRQRKWSTKSKVLFFWAERLRPMSVFLFSTILVWTYRWKLGLFMDRSPFVS